MEALRCKMCDSNELEIKESTIVCRVCGTQYIRRNHANKDTTKQYQEFGNQNSSIEELILSASRAYDSGIHGCYDISIDFCKRALRIQSNNYSALEILVKALCKKYHNYYDYELLQMFSNLVQSCSPSDKKRLISVIKTSFSDCIISYYSHTDITIDDIDTLIKVEAAYTDSFNISFSDTNEHFLHMVFQESKSKWDNAYAYYNNSQYGRPDKDRFYNLINTSSSIDNVLIYAISKIECNSSLEIDIYSFLIDVLLFTNGASSWTTELQARNSWIDGSREYRNAWKKEYVVSDTAKQNNLIKIEGYRVAIKSLKSGQKHDINSEFQHNSQQSNQPIKIIQCMGATVFNLDRKLYIWNDRISLLKDSGESVFSVSMKEIRCLKNGGFFVPTYMSLELKNGKIIHFKLDGNNIQNAREAKELPDFINKLASNGGNDQSEFAQRNPSIRRHQRSSAEPKKQRRKDYDNKDGYSGNHVAFSVLAIIIVTTICASAFYLLIYKKEQSPTTSLISNPSQISPVIVTSDEPTNNVASFEETLALPAYQTVSPSDWIEYIGVVKFMGDYYVLDLNDIFAYRDPVTSEPIMFSNIIIPNSESSTIRPFEGTTMTIEGSLFNFRNGGSIMFNEYRVAYPSHDNSALIEWDNLTNQEKFFKAISLLETVLYRNADIWSVRILCDETTLSEIKNGFLHDFNPVMVSINDSWTSDQEVYFYVTPYKEFVRIIVDDGQSIDYSYWEYTWGGDCNLSPGYPLESSIFQILH